MIAGAMPGGTPFWRHVAERYPDPVVLDVGAGRETPFAKYLPRQWRGRLCA